MDKRASSRGMKRIHAGSQINKVDSNGTQSQNKESKLETIQNLPAGFDPIFSSKSNQTIVNSSNIKIKPMRLSKGFDFSEFNREAFENN